MTEKTRTETAVDRAYKKYIRTQRPHHEREMLHLNEELATHLPIEDRMYILNLVGRKTKTTPFVRTYYCRCGQKFYDRDDYSPRDYRVYRREVICPHCYRCNFNETRSTPQRQERRQANTSYTMKDFIRQMFN